MAKWGEIKCNRCEELEAKLAKAVEVLGGVMRHMPDHPDTVWIEASETLAELTGGKDEWKCPINYTGCTKNCGSYGCGN